MEMHSDEFSLRCWHYKPDTLKNVREIISTKVEESIQIMLIPNARQDLFFCFLFFLFRVSKDILMDPF